MIDWAKIYRRKKFCSKRTSRRLALRLDNFAKCIGAATVEYARWRASMRELFGWKFEG